MDNPNAVTFDFIWNCWKEGKYPDGFDDLLEKYLMEKEYVFGNAPMDDITSWMKKVILAIEIGRLRDEERFGVIQRHWHVLLGKPWKASIEDKWVEWVD